MTTLAAAVALALALAGCGAGTAADSSRVRVVATISILADFAREVGGGAVDVESIVDVGADPTSTSRSRRTPGR